MKFKTKVKKHAPAILTGLAIIGTIGAVVSAIKCKPKYDELVEEKQKEREDEKEEITKKDVVVCAMRAYWPTLLLVAASATCAIASTYIGARRVAETAAIASTTKKCYDEYRAAVEKKVKEHTRDEIEDEIAKSKMEQAETKMANAPSEKTHLFGKGRGDQLFFDCWSGRYFEAESIEDIRSAINSLNEEILNCPSVPVNSYYQYLGLPETDDGERLEWVTGEKGFRCLDVRYIPKLIDDGPFKGRTCIGIKFAAGSEPFNVAY